MSKAELLDLGKGVLRPCPVLPVEIAPLHRLEERKLERNSCMVDLRSSEEEERRLRCRR